MTDKQIVCADCDSVNFEFDRMILAVGQEGNPPKEIEVCRCVDCGSESHNVISS